MAIFLCSLWFIYEFGWFSCHLPSRANLLVAMVTWLITCFLQIWRGRCINEGTTWDEKPHTSPLTCESARNTTRVMTILKWSEFMVFVQQTHSPKLIKSQLQSGQMTVRGFENCRSQLKFYEHKYRDHCLISFHAIKTSN